MVIAMATGKSERIGGAPSMAVKAMPFVIGGVSGCIATCCVQPIDMIKVRLQLAGEGGATGTKSPFKVFSNVVKNEGALTLYKGLDAGITRQVMEKLAFTAHL